MEYGLKKKTNLTYEDTIIEITNKLKKEGFGVLTKIDVKATLKEKLNVEFSKYMILGACNPDFAYKALTNEFNIGLLLPCNVLVYEKDNEVFINAINPSVAMSFVDNENLKNISEEVTAKLKRIIEEF